MNTDDDLKLLRDSWGTPEAPSSGARAAARAALLERAADDPSPTSRRGRLPLRRPAVRLAVVLTLAAVIAMGVTVLQTSGGGRPVVPGIPSGSVAGAAETLDRAADAAEHRPFTPPRPDQWVYTHYKNLRVKQHWQFPRGIPSSMSIAEEQWARADGGRSAWREGRKLHYVDVERPRREVWPPSSYAELAALPTDPDALLDLIQRKLGRSLTPPRPPGVTPACPLRNRDLVYSQLLGMLGSGMPPPRVEATIYRAMKKVPGMVVATVVNPSTGRAEVALGRHVNEWQFNEVLFDARTYRYVGQRSTAVKDPREVMRRCGSLQLMGGLNMRIIGGGIVDKAGQRPR